jgi:hypothetical protein
MQLKHSSLFLIFLHWVLFYQTDHITIPSDRSTWLQHSPMFHLDSNLGARVLGKYFAIIIRVLHAIFDEGAGNIFLV